MSNLISKLLFFFSFVLYLLKVFINKIKNTILFQPTIGGTIEYYNNRIKEKVIEYETNKKIHILQFINPNSNYHILYSHGNAGNIYNRIPILDNFGKYYSITIFDYNGYGNSTGHPCEQSFFQSIKIVYQHLISNSINPKNIILYGESIGCSVVSWLANELIETNNKPKALVLQSGFSSLRNIVSDICIFIPKQIINLLIPNEFNTLEYLKEINIPILILHSKTDEIINYKHSKEILKCNKNCKFNEIFGGHNTTDYNENFFKSINHIIDN